MEKTFRVAASSRSNAIGGAIARVIRSGSGIVLQAIGAGAVNQAVKAIALARAYLADDNMDIVFVPEFIELEIEGDERTAMRFCIDRPGNAFPPATPIDRQQRERIDPKPPD